MLAIKRHEKIIEMLSHERSVKVSDLSSFLQVTEKTVREDLEKLEEKGLLKRIHGGAVISHGEDVNRFPASSPGTNYLQDKQAIARRALEHIEANDIIILDAGSTTLEIAKLLENVSMTVITNDLFIISELVKKDQIRLVVPGGYRYRNMLVSQESLEFVRKLNVRKAFLSASGVHLDYGLTIFTSELLEQKKAFINCAKTIYCVADHSKFEKNALMTFAKLGEVHKIITDKGLAESIVRKFEAAGAVIEQ